MRKGHYKILAWMKGNLKQFIKWTFNGKEYLEWDLKTGSYKKKKR